MDKIGGERLLSLYWFVILGIITVGIVSGVLYVTGSNMDAREAEASLLKEKLVDCLVDGGKLNERIYSSDNLLEQCRINLEDSKYEEVQYAIQIDDDKKFGNQRLLVLCDVKSKEVRCVETKIYVLNNNKGTDLTIKTVVGKEEQNV